MNYCPYCCGPVDKYGNCLEHCGGEPDRDNANTLELRPGTKLRNGTMVLGKCLGQGGFGITYAAWDTKLNRRVAVKESFPSFSPGIRREGNALVVDAGVKELFDKCQRLFKRESDSLKTLKSVPNVIKVQNDFAENNTFYYEMDYVSGKTLKKILEEKKDKRMSWNELSPILRPLMDALQQVHDHYIIHRDIAPDNIMLDKNGQPVLLDFGATKYFGGEITNSTGNIRKPHYSPYEQCTSGKDVGTWSDVYSMGATIYRALSGKNPVDAVDRFSSDTLEPLSRLNPAVPAYVSDAVKKAMCMEIKNRYQTVQSFSQDLWKDEPPVPGDQKNGPSLLCIDGCYVNRTFKIEERMSLGRLPDCNNVCLDNQHVSRHHCEIIYNPEKQECNIRDCRSTNGTMIERGEATIQLQPGQWERLENGDKIYIGPFDVFQYKFSRIEKKPVPGKDDPTVILPVDPTPKPRGGFRQKIYEFLMGGTHHQSAGTVIESPAGSSDGTGCDL